MRSLTQTQQTKSSRFAAWMIERLLCRVILAQRDGEAAAVEAATMFASVATPCTQGHVAAPEHGPCELCVAWELQRVWLSDNGQGWRPRKNMSSTLPLVLWHGWMREIAISVVCSPLDAPADQNDDEPPEAETDKR